MKHKRLLLAFVCGILLQMMPASAQEDGARPDNFESYSQFLSPEKLYLHTDRDVYCVGDTVFFKGYLRNASAFSHYGECNYIYVDLTSTMVEPDAVLGKDVEKDAIRGRVKVKRDFDGNFSGYIPVPSNLNSGIAVLRGYSYWMLNKDVCYMFNKNIEIRNPLKDDSIRNLEKSGVRETLRYTELGVSNPFSRQPKESQDVDVQFLPESGRYLPDTPCTIGIRSVGTDGLGCAVSGLILADGEPLGEFSTDALGFARIELAVPSDAKNLRAEVNLPEGGVKKLAFPKPSPSAAVIRCRIDSTGLRVEVLARGINPSGALRVIAYDRSEVFYEAPYDEHHRIIEFPYASLSGGINNIALADAAGNVYAERAVFVCPDGSVSASVRPSVPSAEGRKKVSCSVDLQRVDGAIMAGDFSVSVMDDGYAPYSGSGYNVVSYMYLGSELQSFVQDSWRYFNPARPLSVRLAEADLLMLTQGWKYYDLQSILKGSVPLPLCGKEYTQSIAGRIIYPIGKRARKANVSFLAPSIRYSSIHQLDTTGSFVLSGLDFPHGTRFLVSAESLGGNRFFTPVLDNDVFARDCSYQRYLKPSPYDYSYKSAAMPLYYNEDGTQTMVLNTSYVTANRVNQQRNISPFPEYQFKPGQYRSQEQMAPYETYDIASYVVTNFPGVRVDTTSAGEYGLLCRTNKVSTRMTISSGWEPVIIFIDRMQGSYDELLQYTIGDLEGLAFVSGPDASRFASVIGSTTSPRSVLMIKTRPINKVPSNVTAIKPLGWQKPARFYQPVYDTPASRRVPENIRPTLYWNPALSMDENGHASFSFYTSSHFAPCTIVVEGMTCDGRPVFCTAHLERE